MSTLYAAFKLVALGFHVFPVWGVTSDGKCTCGRADCKHLSGGKPGKRSAIQSWPNTASQNRRIVSEWWTRFPNANVGIHAKGLLIIDVDGPRGHRSLQRLRRYGNLPKTATIRSGNTKPQHYQLVYRLPPHAGQIKNKLLCQFPKLSELSSIDVKSAGGYVIGPGSRHHSGGFYRWDSMPSNFEDITQAPDWLIALLTEPSKAGKPRQRFKSGKLNGKSSRGNQPKKRPRRNRGLMESKDIRYYAIQMTSRYPVRRAGTRKNRMTAAVASLIGRGFQRNDVERIMHRWLKRFRSSFRTPIKQARAELIECIGRTIANPQFQSTDYKSVRDSIQLPAAAYKALSRKFGRGSLDWMFAEALLVMFDCPSTLTDDGDLRTTNADWKRIIKARHSRTIDNQQITRLKRAYVTTSSHGPAQMTELLVEVRKGGRNLSSGRGRPSVYRPTGIIDLIPDSSSFFSVSNAGGKKQGGVTLQRVP